MRPERWRSRCAQCRLAGWTRCPLPRGAGARASRAEPPPGSVARRGEEEEAERRGRGQRCERGSDRPADHRRGHPRPWERPSPGRSLKGGEAVEGFVCRRGPGRLRCPRLVRPRPQPHSGLSGGRPGRQRVIVGPCEMCSPFSPPLRSRTSVCHQGGWMGGEMDSSSPPRGVGGGGGRHARAGFSAPDVPVCRRAAGGAKLTPSPRTSSLRTEPGGVG